jgi:predicted nucleotidyltransferase
MSTVLNKHNEELVQRLVKKLVSDYSPQRVILFGSYAYGTPGRDSDIDLLIIKDTQESFFDRLTRVRKVVSGTHKGVPFDPLVLTPDELEARLQADDQFIEEILEKGRVVYDP